jgi:hypothetical protein
LHYSCNIYIYINVNGVIESVLMEKVMATRRQRPLQAFWKLRRIHPAAYYDGHSLWRLVETAALSGAQRGEWVLQELPGFTGWQREAAINRDGICIHPHHHWRFKLRASGQGAISQ